MECTGCWSGVACFGRISEEQLDHQRRLIPDTAHDIVLEANWERAAGAMRQWLKHTLEPLPA